METFYRIYAKFEGQKQFKPVDWKQGQQVTNLIYATIIRPNNLENAIKTISSAALINKALKLEIRDNNNKTIFKAY